MSLFLASLHEHFEAASRSVLCVSVHVGIGLRSWAQSLSLPVLPLPEMDFPFHTASPGLSLPCLPVLRGTGRSSPSRTPLPGASVTHDSFLPAKHLQMRSVTLSLLTPPVPGTSLRSEDIYVTPASDSQSASASPTQHIHS